MPAAAYQNDKAYSGNGSDGMNYKIIPVEFPNDGALCVAVSSHDGSFNIYVNELFPEAERMAGS